MLARRGGLISVMAHRVAESVKAASTPGEFVKLAAFPRF